jgi:transposase
MAGRGLPIRDDVSASELRRLAHHERDPAAARRMYTIASALEGMTRAEAARLAGMEREALRDAVVRYNAEGLKGLYNRRRPPRPGKLTAAELQELSQIILAGPDPELGLSAWTLPELCRLIEARFNKHLHPASLSRILLYRDNLDGGPYCLVWGFRCQAEFGLFSRARTRGRSTSPRDHRSRAMRGCA